MNKLRKQEQEYRQRDRKEHDSNVQGQIKELRSELHKVQRQLHQTESDAAKASSKLTFECEDAKYRLKLAESQLQRAILEKNQAIEYVEKVRDQETEIPLNVKTIGELRKKIQQLEVNLAKERKEGGLLQSLQALQEENIAAQTLMAFLSFIFSRSDRIDKQRYEYLKDIFDKAQYRLIEAYETKIGTLN